MPSLDAHQSGDTTKLLMIGDSGTGKTGSLLSLLKAGFKIRVIDMDNGLDFLANEARKKHPELLKNFEYVTLRDKLKLGVGGQGIVPVGIPNAYTRAVGLMEKWEDGSKPSEWGREHILVLDSFTFLSSAAFEWKLALNPGVKDMRQIYGSAQEAVEEVLQLLTAAEFNTNLIVMSHIRWISRPDGTMKGYPTAVGEALSSKIATYFNSTVLVESSGSGNNVKRTIRTTPTALIDLKNPAGTDMPQTLTLETGLADFFKAVRN